MKYLRILLITALLLTACGEKLGVSQSANSILPLQNTAPRYFIKISGVVEPDALTEPLSFEMVYAAMNPKCAQVDNWFEGVTTPSLIKQEFVVSPNKVGLYYLSIPLDFYQPGTCDWEPYYLTYYSGATSGNDSFVPIEMMVAGFSNSGRDNITALKKEVWVCRVKNECHLKRAREDIPKLFGNKNYSLGVDVRLSS